MGSMKSVLNNITGIGQIVITVAFLLILLANFLTISGTTTESNTAINTGITQVGTIMNWLGIAILAFVIVWIYPQIRRAMSNK